MAERGGTILGMNAHNVQLATLKAFAGPLDLGIARGIIRLRSTGDGIAGQAGLGEYRVASQSGRIRDPLFRVTCDATGHWQVSLTALNWWEQWEVTHVTMLPNNPGGRRTEGKGFTKNGTIYEVNTAWVEDT